MKFNSLKKCMVGLCSFFMITVFSLHSFADPQTYTFRITDKEGNPVPNLEAAVAQNNLYNPDDHFSYKSIDDTDYKGEFTLILKHTAPLMVSAAPEIYQQYTISELPQKDGVYQVVWEEETPKQNFERTEKGIRVRVVDKQNKPIPGMKILITELREGEEYFITKGYTDMDGCCYCLDAGIYVSNRDNLDNPIELRLSVYQNQDTSEEKVKKYRITPNLNQQNRYIVRWEE